jgi:hypothetical protein
MIQSRFELRKCLSHGRAIASVTVFCSLLLMGCPQQQQTYKELGKEDDVTNTSPPEEHHHDAGPHGGHIIELGKYHGEVTVAPDRVVTLYILDGEAKNAAPVADAKAELHVHSGDQEQIVILTAAPLEGEADGKASRFSAGAEKIPESIKDIEDLEGEVVLIIAGEKTIGEIAHDHDHDHAHDHAAEKEKPAGKDTPAEKAPAAEKEKPAEKAPVEKK